ncbi:hypothetical protein ACSSS7_000110 [Eimeria intestinalis]
MSAISQDLDEASYFAGVVDLDAGLTTEWQAPSSLKGTIRSADDTLEKGPPEVSATRASSGGLPWAPTPTTFPLSVSAGSPSVHTLLATEPDAIMGGPNVEGLHAAKPAASPQYTPKITYWGVAVVAMLLILAATSAPLRGRVLSPRQELWRARTGSVEEGMLSEVVREGLSKDSHEVGLSQTGPSLSLHAPRALQVSVLSETLASTSSQYRLPDKGEAAGWLSAAEATAARASSPPRREPVRMWADLGLGQQASSGVAFDPFSKSEPQQTEFADDHLAKRGSPLWLPLGHDLDFLDSRSNSPFSGSESEYTTESGSGSSTPTSDAQSKEWMPSELRARVRLSAANSRSRSSDNPRRQRNAASKFAVTPTKKRVVVPAREQHKNLFARGSRRRGLEPDDMSGGSQKGLKRRPLRRLRLNAPDAAHGEAARSSNLVEGLRLVGHRQLDLAFYRVPKAPPNSPYDVESQTIHPELGFFANMHLTSDSASQKPSEGSASTPYCEGCASLDESAEDHQVPASGGGASLVTAVLERISVIIEEGEVEE